MNASALPLITRQKSDSIAFLHKPLKSSDLSSGIIKAEEFLTHVKQLAERLPAHQYCINFCGNRYYFMVALCAVIYRQQTNLLPPNAQTATLTKLYKQYPDSYILHDGMFADEAYRQFDVSLVSLSGDADPTPVPTIAADHLSVISFTSGSTGSSKPNLKTWETLFVSTHINREYMVPHSNQTFFQLATVPSQHMWGLETSVLLPLHSDVCSSDGKPLFPYDVNQHLQALPEPRMLVTTPVHLRALNETSLEYPQVKRVLCATAPLSREIALSAEQSLKAELREIYGCSEIGSMAFKNTAQTEQWQKFSGIDFEPGDNLTIVANGKHLPGPIELSDLIELQEENRFLLKGRSSDMVNIGGKRGSLFEINKLLQNFPGLVDGIVFLPEQQVTTPRLAALVVLKNDNSKEKLKHYLRDHLDPAFIPRPILNIDKLPREANGKLAKKALVALYQKLIRDN